MKCRRRFRSNRVLQLILALEVLNESPTSALDLISLSTSFASPTCTRVQKPSALASARAVVNVTSKSRRSFPSPLDSTAGECSSSALLNTSTLLALINLPTLDLPPPPIGVLQTQLYVSTGLSDTRPQRQVVPALACRIAGL